MRSVFLKQKKCIPLKDLVFFELRFGFLMKNSIYGQMETSGNHQLSRKTKENYRDWGLYFYEVGCSFLLWVKNLVIFELRFRFLMKNSIYGQMETSGNQ